MANDTWWDNVERLSMTNINHQLGYTAEEESRFTGKPLKELEKERAMIRNMPLIKGEDYLGEKRLHLAVMTTSEAAAHYGISPASILRHLRENRIPGFKRPHKHWLVWVDLTSKEFLKMSGPNRCN